MRANKETKAAYFNYIGSIELPLDIIESCYHTGDCSKDIKECIELPEIKAELSEIDPMQLINELKEYGAYTDEELSNHNDNLERIFWIAAGNIHDGMYE